VYSTRLSLSQNLKKRLISRKIDDFVGSLMLQLFDAVIVLTSFSLDLVFIQGITGPQSEEAIALLIIFLLWRILRIINGTLCTADTGEFGLLRGIWTRLKLNQRVHVATD